MQGIYPAADSVQLGFESTGGVVEASYLPSRIPHDRALHRYIANKYSSFFIPVETSGVDDKIIISSADSSNDYVFSKYPLYNGKRILSERAAQNTQFGVRSQQWYSTGRYVNTTVGQSYLHGKTPSPGIPNSLWRIPVVSTVTGPSGDMVSDAALYTVCTQGWKPDTFFSGS